MHGLAVGLWASRAVILPKTQTSSRLHFIPYTLLCVLRVQPARCQTVRAPGLGLVVLNCLDKKKMCFPIYPPMYVWYPDVSTLSIIDCLPLASVRVRPIVVAGSSVFINKLQPVF